MANTKCRDTPIIVKLSDITDTRVDISFFIAAATSSTYPNFTD